MVHFEKNVLQNVINDYDQLLSSLRELHLTDITFLENIPMNTVVSPDLEASINNAKKSIELIKKLEFERSYYAELLSEL